MTLSRHNLAALILAAGYSSRMGQFKPRLPLADRSAIEHAIGAFQEAGVADILVVTGHQAQELASVLEHQRVRCVFNPHYQDGMYSSLVTGVRALPSNIVGCFVLPADVPLVRAESIRELAAVFRKESTRVVYPQFQGRRGHPPLISREVFACILAEKDEGGLRKVLSRFEEQAATVSVLDEGIHLDMDTPADYAHLNVLAACRHVLSRAECEELLENLGVSSQIVRHSRAVAEAAEKLAASLIRRGDHLDLALIRAGSLLHDLAKGTPSHELAGAKVLERLGFPNIAHIVACHADLNLEEGALDEAAIVYLADKLVQEDKVVELEQRFARSLLRYRGDALVLPIVERRLRTAQNIARRVQQRCGMELSEILEDPVHAEPSSVFTDDCRQTVLAPTQSVCPECLQRIKAARIRENSNVYLTKTCPEHGSFKTIVWQGNPSYDSWAIAGKRLSQPVVCNTEIKRGCPFDCGLCPDHRQHPCCVLLEVTQRCDLACTFCFAASPVTQSDPSLETIQDWLRSLLASGGPFNLQLSGGEPTLRDDLPQIVALTKAMGFGFVQVNTNGLRLAQDRPYLRNLKEAGLDCVFLQFDGVTDAVYHRIRGKALLQTKLRAIRNCREEQLGVVLVPTLVPGVNSSQIGRIIDVALREMPTVRAVHFQPVSYFGRYPETPSDRDRITLPDVMRQIEDQTQGKIKATDFYPPSAENAYCSFQGKFTVLASGEIKPSPRPEQATCCAPLNPPAPSLIQIGGTQMGHGEDSKRARESVARQWSFPASQAAQPTQSSHLMNVESLDAFLRESQRNTLSISAMAFQDAWNLDLERLRECFIHVVSPDRRLVPLCAYNLTDKYGHPLYRIPGNQPAMEAVHA